MTTTYSNIFDHLDLSDISNDDVSEVGEAPVSMIFAMEDSMEKQASVLDTACIQNFFNVEDKDIWKFEANDIIRTTKKIIEG